MYIFYILVSRGPKKKRGKRLTKAKRVVSKKVIPKDEDEDIESPREGEEEEEEKKKDGKDKKKGEKKKSPPAKKAEESAGEGEDNDGEEKEGRESEKEKEEKDDASEEDAPSGEDWLSSFWWQKKKLFYLFSVFSYCGTAEFTFHPAPGVLDVLFISFIL